jgi:hypothetical protein
VFSNAVLPIGPSTKVIARIVALGWAMGSLVAPRLVHAHHSFAMFDERNKITLVGTVKELRWTNPHVAVIVYGNPKEGGAPSVWSLELQSPGNLARIGWTRHSLKPGDKIEVLVGPLRDGSHGGAFERATVVDTGQVLPGYQRGPGQNAPGQPSNPPAQPPN